MRPTRGRWLRAFIAALALGLLLAGCKVDTTVSVVVRADGSGVVRVRVLADAEAVQAAESGGAPLEQAVRLSDLADSGWTVGSWAKAQGGSATILLTHPFASVEDVAPIIEGLNGKIGPLPSLGATRDEGLFSTEYGVHGEIDIGAAGSGIADDEQLVAKLAALGVDVGSIDQQLLAQVQSSFGLRVVVKLPDQKPVIFAPGEGATTKQVVASSSVMNTERIIFLVAAVGFGLLGVIVWIRGGRRRRRRGRGRGAGPSPAPARGTRGAPARGRGADGRSRGTAHRTAPAPSATSEGPGRADSSPWKERPTRPRASSRARSPLIRCRTRASRTRASRTWVRRTGSTISTSRRTRDPTKLRPSPSPSPSPSRSPSRSPRPSRRSPGGTRAAPIWVPPGTTGSTRLQSSARCRTSPSARSP